MIKSTALISAFVLALSAPAWAEPPHHDDHHGDHASHDTSDDHDVHEGHNHAEGEVCDPAEHDRLQALVDATKTETVPANIATEGAHEVITANVKGLVCDFCAQAVTKVFKKKAAVDTVDVDLDNGRIVVGLRPGMTLDDATFRKMIRDAGYSLTDMERSDS